jgi:hypothetical protein
MELQDKLSTSIAAHDKLKSDNWQMKNKQIAEKNEWAVAHESTRKVLEAGLLN